MILSAAWDMMTSIAKSGSANPEAWFMDWATGGGRSASGQLVSPESAMRLSAVFACVRARSDDVGKLPCHLYRRLPGGGKERADDKAIYTLIRDTPNPRMTAMEFRQVMQAQVDLRGNAYAWKEFDGRGNLIAMWPLSPNVQVLITEDGRNLFYRVQSAGVPEPPAGLGTITLPAEDVLHLRGPSLNGVTGLSVIGYHRETIGLAQAALEYGAAFFGNSAIPKGGLEIPSTLKPEAGEKLRSDWETRFRGSENAGRLAIFDGGMKWVQVGIDNRDAQYIESRKFSNQEIYALWRMPPHKVGNLERATFSNIEQQSLEYVVDCLLSELIRWEQTLNASLLTADERKTYFFEHLVDGLLRGDIKSRYESYAIARTWGLLNADEIREMENRNPIPDKKGQIYLQPLNMVEAGVTPKPVAAPAPALPAPAPTSPKSARALLAFARELVAREDAKEKSNGAAHTEIGPNEGDAVT